MSVRQHIIPISEFVEAMIETDISFAKDVTRFEESFGTIDKDTLSVLAQARYFCWFEVEYVKDYFEVCRAIGSGNPTSFYLCRQVTPRRWALMNSYVVGIQMWLGYKGPLNDEVDPGNVDKIRYWLDERTAAKEALAELYVSLLIADLLELSLAKLSASNDPEKEEYADFTPWYRGIDGTPFTVDKTKALIDMSKQRVFKEMPNMPSNAQELVDNILKESQPACQHRFSRYQDIKITSIGALKWRGNIPLDDEVPRNAATEWFENANLEGWLANLSPKTNLSRELWIVIGAQTERKRAIIRNFLMVPPPPGFFNFLETRAKREGSKASAKFL
jgi:hypothetical protein